MQMKVLPQASRSLFGEFMLLITMILLPFFFIIGVYVLNNFNQVTEKVYLHGLENLAEAKASAINLYIDNHIRRAEALAIMPVTQQAMSDMFDVFHQNGINSAAYQQVSERYEKTFGRYYSLWNYYDLFLIDVEGDVVFSIEHESDLASNLKTGAYRDTGLAQVFRQAVTMLQTSNSTMAYYAPSKEAAGFIAAPIFKDDIVIGVVAMQFDVEKLYETINNLAGLGETGEIVAGQQVGDHILITVPLRHDLDAAFKRTIARDDENALAIRMSTLGESGSAKFIDWRGKEVLGVWQYLPALKWGLVVKIDTDEAFGFWQQVQSGLIGYAALGLLIVYVLLFFFMRRITRPLRKLTAASVDFGTGRENIQLDALAKIDNETGALARAFVAMLARVEGSESELKAMLEELEQSNRTLDQRVADQTAHIQAIVKFSADGIITMTETGLIDSVNPALCHLFAYSEAELIGQPMTMLMPEAYREGHIKGFNRYLNTPDAEPIHLTAELEGLRKSGEVFPLALKLNEMHVGEQVFFLGSIRDIEQEKIEREKLEHTQRLESLGVLAGGIAHDFNNLLTAILGNAALARSRMDKKSPAIEMLENIEKSSERAAALCKQMLAYSGKGKFIVEPLNLTLMIEEMINLLDVSIQKNIVMRLDLSQQLLPIEADAAQMQQVIMNLVINASEAIDSKSGIITIHTGVVAIDKAYIQTTYMDENLTAGRYIVLEISDTGCGMDADTQKRMFDPFFTTKFTGRGLGMSAILGIVRGHKGAIKVYSELDKGTTFKVLFPCSERLPEEQKDIVAEPVLLQGQGVILIVDDEETIREIASVILEDVGFTVLTAKDGEEGVQMFRQHQTDICAVLLDMTMPRLNGAEVFREIRLMQPDVQVILSSGYNEQDATNRFAGKGLAGFIQKPYSPEALQTMLLNAVAAAKK
ncbi:MAG: response regulator [Mariprofundus sp.]|nr:response regulator [Mariprofundus sp.]